MILSSSCHPWRRLDRPGSAGDHDGLAAVTPLMGTRSVISTNSRNEMFLLRVENQYLVWAQPHPWATRSATLFSPCEARRIAVRTWTRAKRERSRSLVPSRQDRAPCMFG